MHVLVMLLGKSFQIQEQLKTQSGGERSSSGRFNSVEDPQCLNVLMKNSLYQTVFLNVPESERIFPTVGNFPVRNPYFPI